MCTNQRSEEKAAAVLDAEIAVLQARIDELKEKANTLRGFRDHRANWRGRAVTHFQGFDGACISGESR